MFAWSFYNQGTSDKAASADEFIDSALRWFGTSEPEPGLPRDKGERLAGLIRQEPTLLILNGIEPLQWPPGPRGGQLKDLALATLVRELASSNSGLCVITTRVSVSDLASRRHTTAPELDLRHLSPEAGAALLSQLGDNKHRGSSLGMRWHSR